VLSGATITLYTYNKQVEGVRIRRRRKKEFFGYVSIGSGATPST